MNTLIKFINSFALVCLFASSAWAERTYQVTGPVLEVDDSKIVVQKGKDRWELQKDPSVKTEGEVAVGTKVTVEYTMTAKTIEAKAKGKKK